MKPEEFIILFGSRNPRTIDKGDVIIARGALFMVKFVIVVIIAFGVFLAIVF